MRTNHAKTLLATFAMAVGLSGLAHAESAATPSHFAAANTSPRDPYTDGARASSSEAAMLAVAAPSGMSVCKVRGFDPYTDGTRMDESPYGKGGHNGTRDPYTEGGGRTAAGNGCLYRNA